MTEILLYCYVGAYKNEKLRRHVTSLAMEKRKKQRDFSLWDINKSYLGLEKIECI
jgi:hypothetical protein